MSKSAKWLMAALIVIAAASIAAAVYTVAQRPETGEEEEEEAIKTPSHVALENGRVVVRLSPHTQEREGIRTVSLAETSRRLELRGTAVLLPVTELAALRNKYVAARSTLRRAEADLDVSRGEYERVKTLYEENQNMSLKAMEQARAAYGNNQSQVEADRQDARLSLESARQTWGSTVAGWVEHNSPLLEKILEQREFMAQVVFPPGELGEPPSTLELETPGKQAVKARYISPMPTVNAQIQGVSFLYLVPSRPELAVGMNLSVRVPVGKPVRGVFVPESAVVWWQGTAWVYEATAPDTFSRRELPTSNPVTGGYFISSAIFPPATKVVTAGAQELLSEQFRSQIQPSD